LPEQAAGDDFGAGGVFVDRGGQVAGEFEVSRGGGVGEGELQLDGVDREAVLGQHVAVGEQPEQFPFGDGVDDAAVAGGPVVLPRGEGLLPLGLVDLDVLLELDPHGLQQVYQVPDPVPGVDADVGVDVGGQHAAQRREDVGGYRGQEVGDEYGCRRAVVAGDEEVSGAAPHGAEAAEVVAEERGEGHRMGVAAVDAFVGQRDVGGADIAGDHAVGLDEAGQVV